MALETESFTAGQFLIDAETRAEYMKAALEECDGDPKRVLAALGVIARSLGLPELAERIGVTKQGHTSLSENGNPRWETVWRVAEELGLQVTFQAKASGE